MACYIRHIWELYLSFRKYSILTGVIKEVLCSLRWSKMHKDRIIFSFVRLALFFLNKWKVKKNSVHLRICSITGQRIELKWWVEKKKDVAFVIPGELSCFQFTFEPVPIKWKSLLAAIKRCNLCSEGFDNHKGRRMAAQLTLLICSVLCVK